MDAQATAKIPRAFVDMPDPRRNNCSHRLIDVLTVALFAIICGADDWITVEAYGRAKLDWLKTFLKLPHGIPSHDTFGRLFAMLNPVAFERCFMAWVQGLCDGLAGEVVAID